MMKVTKDYKKMRTETIYMTDDYSVFKRLDGNRHIANKRIENIKESINQVGYISNPIIVNEKMEIIDGQGRLEALRQLELPVEYRIVGGLGIEECRAMNLKTTAWALSDYINSYAELGDFAYQKLIELESEFRLGYATIAGIININNKKTPQGGAIQAMIRNGEFKFLEYDYMTVKKVCEVCSRFKDIQKKSNGRKDSFYIAISWIYLKTAADMDRLYKNMLADIEHMDILSSRIEPLLRQFSEIYNHNLAKRSRIYFEYEYKKA